MSSFLHGLTQRVLVTLALALPAVAADDPTWPGKCTLLERGVMLDAAGAIREARAYFKAAMETQPAPEIRRLSTYTVAYSGYRLALLPSVARSERDQLLAEAVGLLKQVTKEDPRSAEAHALLSSVYGLQIGGSLFKGMSLGPRSGAAMDRAVELDPANPRVILLQGIGAFHKPGVFGGGKDKAETLLRKAIVLFEKEPADHPWPNWGRAEAHAWLGEILANRGDTVGSRAEYEKALEIAPDFARVRNALLPKLPRS